MGNGVDEARVRDTIPDAGASGHVECTHCGGTAADGFFAEACTQCEHPGSVVIDDTGAPAWLLSPGKCNDHKCNNCYPGLGMAVEDVKTRLNAVDEELFGRQDASLLATKARELALSLCCSPSTALRLLVDALFRDLEAAKLSLKSASEAATVLAAGELS